MTTESADVATSKPRPRDGLATALLDDELVIYDSTTRTLHQLNPAATLVWLHCDGQRTIEAIASTLADGTTASPTTIRQDVFAVVEELRTASLLVVDD